MYIYAYVAKVTVPANILVWESLRGLRTKKKKNKQTNKPSQIKPSPSIGWTLAAFIHLNPRITLSSHGFVTQ